MIKRSEKRVIDLTQVFYHNMPASSFDDPPKIEKIRTIKDDQYNDWCLTARMHIGTHIDGPGHLTDSKLLLSDIPVEKFVGKGYLVDARNKPIDVSLLAHMPTEPDLIVLVLTGWDKKFETKKYFTDHPVLTEAFAQELINRKVKMVGIDFFSPDKYPFPLHQRLLKHGILIIENLTGLENLIGVKNFEVIALPLKLTTDSALARVIALVKD